MWSSLLVKVGLWLARQGGWEIPVCTLRHWTADDQSKLDLSRLQGAEAQRRLDAELAKPDCTERHWPMLPDGLLDRATVLAADVDTRYPTGYGEAKRHDVYARLVKEFPRASRRSIGLAVELSIP